MRVRAGCLRENSWKPQQGSLGVKPRGRESERWAMKPITPMGWEAGQLWKWYRICTSESSLRAQAAKVFAYQLLPVGAQSCSWEVMFPELQPASYAKYWSCQKEVEPCFLNGMGNRMGVRQPRAVCIPCWMPS